ncbi:patatin-like phospholipase family protein [Hoeflea sp. IMCC20628]|uniref:patatin-like phospholipase family protein n=1 Tax=Hoeflea sp. IMCC20628 TaxID=1620421 RepID=UPI0018CCC7E3|nr:patatin-like phospholipase family protein [Hoeflea sp. IMCC20628]
MSLLRSALGVAMVIMLSLALNGCASLPRTALAEPDQDAAQVEGFSGIRFWGDGSADERASSGPIFQPQAGAGRISYLAISGGGSGGAFGAGFLTGWSESGMRPEFDVVSGVSTGALIAPFAFLGRSHDPVLAELYTSGIAETLIRPRPVSLLFGAGLSDPTALRRLVGHYVTEDMLRKIASEHLKGRRLFVATTNLDAQRTVIWDMGAIAASGDTRALTLFRDVLIASASIPAVFPPVMIDVSVNGRRFQEMHSDGGATTQLFTAPESFLASTDLTPPIRPGRADLYILLNNMLDPEFEVVKPSTLAIAGRAYSTLVKTHARATVNATYTLTRRAGISFNLAYLDQVVPYDISDPFNTDYMRRLFKIGREKALSTNGWRKRPPAASSD